MTGSHVRSAGLPPGAEDDNHGPPLIVFSSFMAAISIVSISLRFISRGLLQRGQRFWWDDWIALLSLPFILGLMATIYRMVHHGLGRRLAFVSEEDFPEFIKLLFASYFVYDIALAVTKCSVLLFFSRIFPRRQSSAWFNWSLYTAHAFNCIWLIGTIVGTILICSSAEKNWIPNMPSHCGPRSGLWHGSSATSAFIDLLILLLPLPKILSLRLSKARRLGIIGVFLIGYCAVIVSIGRLVTTLMNADKIDVDITYEIPPTLFWVAAEAPVTLFSICLPAMLPLFQQIATKVLPRSNSYSAASRYAGQSASLRSKSGNFGGTTASREQGVQMRSFDESGGGDDNSIRSEESWKDILAGPELTAYVQGPDPSAPRRILPAHRIVVERHITVDTGV